MSITRAVRKATRRAFKVSKEELVSATYLKYGTETYDPISSTNTRPITLQETVEAFLTSFTEKEILAGIASPKDQRLTIEGSKVTWEVSVHDEVKIKGQIWRIEEDKTPLTKAVVILRLQKA